MKLKIIEQFKKNKEKTIRLLGRFIKILMYLLIFILLVFIVINTKSIKTFNYEIFVIVSESMKPEIKKGDIIINTISKDDINIGDIITFEKNYEYVTHRVKELKQQDGKRIYITKGDNNQVSDFEEVYYDEVRGKVVAVIPYLGLLILSKSRIVIIFLILFVMLYIRARKIDNKKIERIKKKRIEDEKTFKNN